jgi:hypothetical protein
MNLNYSIIPCFVEKNPKTFKIYVISKQSLWICVEDYDLDAT